MGIPFKESKTLKPKDYFQHTLGITLGKRPVEEIELWFSPAMAPYIKTQHPHHSQKTVAEDERGLVISLKLIPNPELTQLILSYGAEVMVVKPFDLADQYSKYLKLVGEELQQGRKNQSG
jgi:predicted DNA-binding transcriptional regulator YafY